MDDASRPKKQYFGRIRRWRWRRGPKGKGSVALVLLPSRFDHPNYPLTTRCSLPLLQLLLPLASVASLASASACLHMGPLNPPITRRRPSPVLSQGFLTEPPPSSGGPFTLRAAYMFDELPHRGEKRELARCLSRIA